MTPSAPTMTRHLSHSGGTARRRLFLLKALNELALPLEFLARPISARGALQSVERGSAAHGELFSVQARARVHLRDVLKARRAGAHAFAYQYQYLIMLVNVALSS